MAYVKTRQNHKSATITCLSNCFYLALWSRFAGRSSQTSEKCSILSIFGSGSFSPEFSTVREVAKLVLHEIIKIWNVIAWLIVFI